MADGISATGGVATSYMMGSHAQAAPADGMKPAADAQPAAVKAVEAVAKADASRTDNDNRSPKLSVEQQTEQLQAAVEKINEMMKAGERSLAFSVDKDLNQVVVTVTNTETEEVVRQIPNEEALEFAKHMESMMGLIFNEKA